MQKRIIIVAAVIAIVIVVAASAAWIFTSPRLSEQEKARDAVINYIKTNHAETAPLIKNLSWEGGIRNNYLVGEDTYIYGSQGWTVIIHIPVVPNPIYTIETSCTSGSILVVWHGTYQNSAITETSYRYTP